jgi:hypothetical protein
MKKPKNKKKNKSNKKKSFISDSDFSDTCSVNSNESEKSLSKDPNYFLNIQDDADQRGKWEKQMSKMSFKSSNKAPAPMNTANKHDRIDMERELAFDGGYSNFNPNKDMTYGFTSKENFTHNNMAPFFKGGGSYGPGSNDDLSRLSQRKVDLFTGNDDDFWQPKKTIAPLKSPIEGKENLFGMPPISDFMQSRVNPSRNKDHELPFTQIKVGPGVGVGYKGNQGVGDINLFRPKMKTTDDLRPLDNPKTSYTIPLNRPGGQEGQARPQVGYMSKNRPERTINPGNYFFVKKDSDYRAPKYRSYIDKSSFKSDDRGNKELAKRPGAPTYDTQPIPENLKAKVRPSKKQNFRQADPRNAIIMDGGDQYIRSKDLKAKETQGEFKTNYAGPSNYNAGGYVYNYRDNTPSNTMRDIHKAERNQAPASYNVEQGYVYNHKDNTPSSTMRDIHKSSRSAGGSAFNVEQGYVYNHNDNKPSATMRDIHKAQRNQAPASYNVDQGYRFNYNDNKHSATMRDIHKAKRNQAPASYNVDQGYVYNYNDNKPSATMRDIHKAQRNQAPASYNVDQGYVYNYNDNKPSATMRDIHKAQRNQAPASYNVEQGYVYNYNDNKPMASMKDIHKAQRSQAPASYNVDQGYVYNYNDNKPTATMKDIHKSSRSAGGGAYHIDQGYVYNYGDNKPTATMKDIHKSSRSAGGGAYHIDQGYVYNYEDNKPIATMKDIHKSSRSAGGGAYHVDQGYVYNYGDNKPTATMKDIHKSSRSAGGGAYHVDQGYVYNYEDNKPAPTLKDMVAKTKQLRPGNTSGGIGGEHVREDLRHAKTNEAKEKAVTQYRTPGYLY